MKTNISQRRTHGVEAGLAHAEQLFSKELACLGSECADRAAHRLTCTACRQQGPSWQLMYRIKAGTTQLSSKVMGYQASHFPLDWQQKGASSWFQAFGHVPAEQQAM